MPRNLDRAQHAAENGIPQQYTKCLLITR